MPIVPPSFLFHYQFRVPQQTKLPKSGQALLNLPAECRIPVPSELDDRKAFADVRLGWNRAGLGLSLTTRGRKKPVVDDPPEANRLEVLIDTRDTRNVHRATRFCRRFVFTWSDGGDDPVANVAIEPISHAREVADGGDVSLALTRLKPQADGYLLEVWLPEEVLPGYDIEASRKIGFYYTLSDAELGEQTLHVSGPEFPVGHDPSLWCTLELVDA